MGCSAFTKMLRREFSSGALQTVRSPLTLMRLLSHVEWGTHHSALVPDLYASEHGVCHSSAPSSSTQAATVSLPHSRARRKRRYINPSHPSLVTIVNHFSPGRKDAADIYRARGVCMCGFVVAQLLKPGTDTCPGLYRHRLTSYAECRQTLRRRQRSSYGEMQERLVHCTQLIQPWTPVECKDRANRLAVNEAGWKGRAGFRSYRRHACRFSFLALLRFNQR